MATVKERMTEVFQSQPEDATYEEIMRELAFECWNAVSRTRDYVEPCQMRKWLIVSAHGRNRVDGGSSSVVAGHL